MKYFLWILGILGLGGVGYYAYTMLYPAKTPATKTTKPTTDTSATGGGGGSTGGDSVDTSTQVTDTTATPPTHSLGLPAHMGSNGNTGIAGNFGSSIGTQDKGTGATVVISTPQVKTAPTKVIINPSHVVMSVKPIGDITTVSPPKNTGLTVQHQTIKTKNASV